MYRNKGIKSHISKQKGDSADLQRMLAGIEVAEDYKEHIIRNCINLICPPSRRDALNFDDVVKCAIALGKRQFALEVLPSTVNDLAIDHRESTGELKKKKWRWWK